MAWGRELGTEGTWKALGSPAADASVDSQLLVTPPWWAVGTYTASGTLSSPSAWESLRGTEGS